MDCDRFNGMLVSMPYSHSGLMSCFFRKQNSVQIRRELRLMDIASFSTATASAHWGAPLSPGFPQLA